jgi:hypothetical protein
LNRLLVGVAALVSAWTAGAAEFIVVDLDMNAVAFSTHTGRLYGSVPSTAGLPYGNGLVEIDPATGVIGESVFVGSEPVAIAVSPDAAVAYVGLNGAAAVRRVDLAMMTADLQFSLGSNVSLGPHYAEEIAVQPGAPDTVAVSRRNQGFSPRHMGVAIFDAGIQRPSVTAGHTGSNAIVFGAQPQTLIGYNNETTDFGVREMQVSASGVAVVRTVSNVISGFGVRIIYSNNVVYASSGRAVDASTLQLQGTYAASGPVAVDVSLDLVAFATGAQVKLFDRETFILLDTITIPSGSSYGQPLGMVSCEAGCLAVRYSESKLVIVQDVLSLETIFADSFERNGERNGDGGS